MHIHFAIGRPVVGARTAPDDQHRMHRRLGARCAIVPCHRAVCAGARREHRRDDAKIDALYVQDLVVGGGTAAGAKQVVAVIYTGWLANGTKFDSNTGQAPLTFTLGTHEVIDGWDQGVEGMRVGGRRRLVIGAALGYGAAGSGPIPPNSTLVFDVELRAVQ